MKTKTEKYLKIDATEAGFLKQLQEWEIEQLEADKPIVFVMLTKAGTYNVEWKKAPIFKNIANPLAPHRATMAAAFQELKKKYNSPAIVGADVCLLEGLSEKDAEAAAAKVYDIVHKAMTTEAPEAK